MPNISWEALTGAALVVGLAVGYRYIQNSDQGDSTATSSSRKNKKKNKKKGKGSTLETEPVPVETPSNTKPSAASKQKATKSKPEPVTNGPAESQTKPKPVGIKPPAAPPAPTPTQQPAGQALSSDTQKSSFADIAAGDSEPAANKPQKPKTLAEKMVPKPRKTKVDDMLAPEDQPAPLARVMRITGGDIGAHEKVEKFADDYVDSDTASGGSGRSSEGGWNVVAAKKKPVSVSIGGSSSSGPSVAIASNPYSHDGLTKIQRKNQKKAEAKKAAKAADEADRLRRLAMHKREQERVRIDEIYRSNQKTVRSQGKVLSGGQQASVSSTGQLVWD